MLERGDPHSQRATTFTCWKGDPSQSEGKGRAKGIDMAIRLTQEEETSLECWKDVTPHNQSAMVMTKEKQTI